MVNLRMDATVVKESMIIQWTCEVCSNCLQTIFDRVKVEVFSSVETSGINQTGLADAVLEML